MWYISFKEKIGEKIANRVEGGSRLAIHKQQPNINLTSLFLGFRLINQLRILLLNREIINRPVFLKMLVYQDSPYHYQRPA